MFYFCRNHKARANIYVYSSTLFSGVILETKKLYSMVMIPGTAWYVIWNRTGLLVSCYGKGPSMPRRNWSIRWEEPSLAITADLRPFVTHTGLAVSTALFLLVIIIITHSSSMKGPRLNFHAERELAHPKTTFFSSFLQLQQYTHVRRRRVVCR